MRGKFFLQLQIRHVFLYTLINKYATLGIAQASVVHHLQDQMHQEGDAFTGNRYGEDQLWPPAAIRHVGPYRREEKAGKAKNARKDAEIFRLDVKDVVQEVRSVDKDRLDGKGREEEQQLWQDETVNEPKAFGPDVVAKKLYDARWARSWGAGGVSAIRGRGGARRGSHSSPRAVGWRCDLLVLNSHLFFHSPNFSCRTGDVIYAKVKMSTREFSLWTYHGKPLQCVLKHALFAKSGRVQKMSFMA